MKLLSLILTLALAALAVRCSSGEEVTPTLTPIPTESLPDQIVSLEIAPQESAIDESESRKYLVVAILSDGTRVDVSPHARWRTSDDSIVSVDRTGLVTARASGSANLQAEVEGKSSEALTLEVFIPFTTEDGITLRGRLFGKGEAVVVLAHMFPADQTSWYPFALALADAGYSAFTFDFRGYGVSEGEKVIPEIDKDLKAALALVRGRGFRDVFFIGASMGGTASIKVAAQEEVSGVVAISAPVEFRGLDAEVDIARVDEPKLFVAAEGDRGAAISARDLHDKATGPKEVVILPGAAHGTNILTSPEGDQLRALLLNFLVAHAAKD